MHHIMSAATPAHGNFMDRDASPMPLQCAAIWLSQKWWVYSTLGLLTTLTAGAQSLLARTWCCESSVSFAQAGALKQSGARGSLSECMAVVLSAWSACARALSRWPPSLCAWASSAFWRRASSL